MNIDYNQLRTLGYLNKPIPKNLNLVEAIAKLKKEKNAVILAHYYQDPEIQDVADFVGDSLALSQQAAKTEADIIVFAGVHFMAETAKTLSPSKKVLLPDLNAGCSLADSAPADEFAEFVRANPDHMVVSYVNTTNAIKALSDIVVTSTNAVQIVESIPKEQKIIFGPDKNLGGYINSVTGRDMLLWNGACHVHQDFSLQEILRLKAENPEAKVIAHPECPRQVLLVSDKVGSTKALLDFTQTDPGNTYIVATEWGILHQMKKANPQKTFIPAPPEHSEDASCACNECKYMRLNTLAKLYNCLKYEAPEIELSEEIIKKAYKPIQRMLDISAKLGL